MIHRIYDAGDRRLFTERLFFPHFNDKTTYRYDPIMTT